MNAPAPSPSPAPAPAPAPSPAPAPAPAATRPEWVPETYFDPAVGIKPEFGTHYAELNTFHQTETQRRAALAARKPEDIKFEVKLPETVKVPDGFEVRIDEKDPRVPVLRDLAIKHGWDQDTVTALVTLDAQQKIEHHTAEMNRIAAEDAKLGANATQRKEAVANWLKGLKDNGTFTAEEYAGVRDFATDAATISAIEKLIAKANGSIPANPDNQPPKPADTPMESRWYQQKAS